MARQRPDLVLLDLMMPVLDGFGVLEAMRERESTRDIPVIVLTAQILTSQDMARLQQGVAAVLSKGLFTGAEVLAQVTDALGRSKRLGSEAQRVVRQAMAYIHEHYAEPFSREELAVAVGLNDRYLTQLFPRRDRPHPDRVPQSLPDPAGPRPARTRRDEHHRGGAGHRLLRPQLLRPRLPRGGRRDPARLPARRTSQDGAGTSARQVNITTLLPFLRFFPPILRDTGRRPVA